MKKVPVTGGTVFVSRYIAEYYVAKGYDVYVINRNTKEQSRGVKLIQADRHELGDILKDLYFDIVIDTAYTAYNVDTMLDALGEYGDYILISSSAVYPEYGNQPFVEGAHHDLCRFMEVLLEKKPQQRIYNVGNKESISIREWVKLCYEVVGKDVTFIEVHEELEQRNYFSFYNYQYCLDVSKQYELMQDVKPLKDGLEEALQWYLNNTDKVYKKPYLEFIEQNLEKIS